MPSRRHRRPNRVLASGFNANTQRNAVQLDGVNNIAPIASGRSVYIAQPTRLTPGRFYHVIVATPVAVRLGPGVVARGLGRGRGFDIEGSGTAALEFFATSQGGCTLRAKYHARTE